MENKSEESKTRKKEEQKRKKKKKGGTQNQIKHLCQIRNSKQNYNT